jgi:hypothetical protein
MPPISRVIIDGKIDAGEKTIAENQHAYDGYSGKNNKAIIGGKIKINVRLV